MQVVPFGKNDIITVAVTTVLPLLPLVFTIWSPQQLFARVLKIML
jgi:hypothetical protein